MAGEEQQTMEQGGRPRAGHGMFKGVKPRAISLPASEPVTSGPLSDAATLPLVFEPAVEGVDLADWAAGNLPLVRRELLRHGALLFRGFGVETAADFGRLTQAITPDLIGDNGEHPRASLGGHVYVPVFYPPEQRLLWHNENSFNHSWPMHIFFCCAQPAARGGETPIVDSRRVYELIDPEIRRRFEEHQVMYMRNYGDGLGLHWRDVFQTTSRAEVEAHCRANFIDFEWKEGGRLRTTAVRPAVVRHPKTGEPSWFNQAQHWHVSCLDAAVRESLLAAFDEKDLPRHCYYGDGSPIADSVMNHILDVYRRLEVTFPWRRGDVLLLDNLLTAHARNPFEGERKLFVAMADATTYAAV